jgi:hypothetical protein
MRYKLASLVAAPLMLIAATSQAQSRWSLEASSDATLARGNPGGFDLGTGVGLVIPF